jgi:hypothetical protein
MLEKALGARGASTPTDQEEMLKRYVLDVVVPPSSPTAVGAPTPAPEPDPIESLHLAWQRACGQLDQASLHYLAAKRALGSAKDTGTGLVRALDRHDQAISALRTACDHCAQVLARLRSCTD